MIRSCVTFFTFWTLINNAQAADSYIDLLGMPTIAFKSFAETMAHDMTFERQNRKARCHKNCRLYSEENIVKDWVLNVQEDSKDDFLLQNYDMRENFSPELLREGLCFRFYDETYFIKDSQKRINHANYRDLPEDISAQRNKVFTNLLERIHSKTRVLFIQDGLVRIKKEKLFAHHEPYEMIYVNTWVSDENIETIGSKFSDLKILDINKYTITKTNLQSLMNLNSLVYFGIGHRFTLAKSQYCVDPICGKYTSQESILTEESFLNFFSNNEKGRPTLKYVRISHLYGITEKVVQAIRKYCPNLQWLDIISDSFSPNMEFTSILPAGSEILVRIDPSQEDDKPQVPHNYRHHQCANSEGELLSSCLLL